MWRQQATSKGAQAATYNRVLKQSTISTTIQGSLFRCATVPTAPEVELERVHKRHHSPGGGEGGSVQWTVNDGYVDMWISSHNDGKLKGRGGGKVWKLGDMTIM